MRALISQQAQASLLNAYTAAKSVIGAQARLTLPPNYFQNIGQRLRFDVTGGLSSLTVTPGTITFQIMMGPTSNIIVFTSGAVQMQATAGTTIPFRFTAWLTLTSVGATTAAAFMGQSEVVSQQLTKTAAQTTDAQADPILMAPETAPTIGTGFDSTAAVVVDFWAGFSISNAANGIQVAQYLVTEELGANG